MKISVNFKQPLRVYFVERYNIDKLKYNVIADIEVDRIDAVPNFTKTELDIWIGNGDFGGFRYSSKIYFYNEGKICENCKINRYIEFDKGKGKKKSSEELMEEMNDVLERFYAAIITVMDTSVRWDEVGNIIVRTNDNEVCLIKFGDKEKINKGMIDENQINIVLDGKEGIGWYYSSY